MHLEGLRLYSKDDVNKLVKICHIPESILNEAEANYDVGLASSELIIRRNANQEIYKMYQETEYLPNSFESTIGQLGHDEARIPQRTDYAIELLLNVSATHNGETSKAVKKMIAEIKSELEHHSVPQSP